MLWEKENETAGMKDSVVQNRDVPDTNRCWALVERITESRQLKRASRLRELLLFVARRSLMDDCEQIHEQEIGIEVFGRPSNYDTNIDNIVRANASELRKRIEAYFETDGAQEAVLMEIPRGSYVPVFRYQTADTALAAEPASEVVSSDLDRRHSIHPAWILMSASILVLAGVCLAVWMQNRRLHESLVSMQQSLYPWRNEPAVSAFWSQFLDTSLDTDVVVADASFSMVENIGKKHFPLQAYLNRAYIDEFQKSSMSPETRSILDRIASSRLGAANAFKLAQRVMSLDPLGKKMHLYFSREYMPAFVDRDNVILIGSPDANPWEQIFTGQVDFIQHSNNDIFSVKRLPDSSPQKPTTSDASTGFCTVAYLPNPGHDGKVLIISGTNAEPTEACGNFLLSESELSGFLQKLKTPRFPYFEVLLRTSQVRGTPLTATIADYRTFPNLH